MMPKIDPAQLRQQVRDIVRATPVLDIHTHLYHPTFGKLLLWGIDDLLTYHYLIAEVFRVAPLPYDKWWSLTREQQAEHIWYQLFVARTPISEACRGVLTVLHALELDTRDDLQSIRRYFANVRVEDYVEKVFHLAGVSSVIMTNDPFDEAERPLWEQGFEPNGTFQAALRIDPLLLDWTSAVDRLCDWGYPVKAKLNDKDTVQVRKFLDDWIARMKPRYMAVSLPPDFAFPEDSPCGRLIEQCIIPAAREANIPFALMIGVRRGVNPKLGLAADGVGRSDMTAMAHLCDKYPDNKFLVTTLSRLDQHELTVTARKFPNLHPFGCWWFLNNPSIIDEMTRQRLELLGMSFTPQHSDARVLDQLIYKWTHSRAIIAEVLADKYIDMADAGRPPIEEEIRRDVQGLFGGVFEAFCQG